MPTPSPIITPRNCAKSGIGEEVRQDRGEHRADADARRARRRSGRPIASTDPKATTRITTAKARPRASDCGSSNSAKAAPPSSTCRPSISGRSSCERLGDRRRPRPSRSPGISRSAKAILPASAPSVAIWGSAAGVVGAGERHPLPRARGRRPRGRARCSSLSQSKAGRRGRRRGRRRSRWTVVNSSVIARLDLGVVDPLLGAEHDRAGDARRRSRRTPRSSVSRPTCSRSRAA